MISSPSSWAFAEETRGDLGVEAENGSEVWFQFSAVPQAPHVTLGIFLSFLQVSGNIPPPSFRWGVIVGWQLCWWPSSAKSVSSASWWAWIFLGSVWRMLSHPSVTEAALWACHCLFPLVKLEKTLLWLCLLMAKVSCLSLSVAFPYKLDSAGSHKRSVLFLCTSCSLCHLNWLNFSVIYD